MATAPLKPLPPATFTVVTTDRRHEQAWVEYLMAVDALLRTVASVALAAPNNANAKAAGVPLGGLYTDTADPAKVYIRTV